MHCKKGSRIGLPAKHAMDQSRWSREVSQRMTRRKIWFGSKWWSAIETPSTWNAMLIIPPQMTFLKPHPLVRCMLCRILHARTLCTTVYIWVDFEQYVQWSKAISNKNRITFGNYTVRFTFLPIIFQQKRLQFRNAAMTILTIQLATTGGIAHVLILISWYDHI